MFNRDLILIMTSQRGFRIITSFLSLPILATGFFVLNACSSPRSKPKPLETTTSAETSILEAGSKTDLPYPMDPEARTSKVYTPLYPLALMGKEFALSAAVVEAARGLSKVGKTQNPRTDLNGNCVYGEPDNPAMVSPCVNVTVQLLQGDQKVLASTMTNRSGDFRFFIPSGESYTVQVLDKKGRMAKVPKTVGRSEYVSIFLKP